MLRIELTKRVDGTGVLRCTRADGSVTWQTQGAHAHHFALHDLTHYAVETTLGYRRGFFGLIAEGWDIVDTTGKGARGRPPADALEVERLVGLFDTERGGGEHWTATEFNAVAPRPLSVTEIHAIRTLRARLFSDWAGVPRGETLELVFQLP